MIFPEANLGRIDFAQWETSHHEIQARFFAVVFVRLRDKSDSLIVPFDDAFHIGPFAFGLDDHAGPSSSVDVGEFRNRDAGLDGDSRTGGKFGLFGGTHAFNHVMQSRLRVTKGNRFSYRS